MEDGEEKPKRTVPELLTQVSGEKSEESSYEYYEDEPITTPRIEPSVGTTTTARTKESIEEIVTEPTAVRNDDNASEMFDKITTEHNAGPSDESSYETYEDSTEDMSDSTTDYYSEESELTTIELSPENDEPNTLPPPEDPVLILLPDIQLNPIPMEQINAFPEPLLRSILHPRDGMNEMFDLGEELNEVDTENPRYCS